MSGTWSTWRWAWHPMPGRWFGRVGDHTYVTGWRIGPFLLWRFDMAVEPDFHGLLKRLRDGNALCRAAAARIEALESVLLVADELANKVERDWTEATLADFQDMLSTLAKYRAARAHEAGGSHAP